MGAPSDQIPDDSMGGAECAPPDLGDIVVVLLASSLAGLRDRLHCDGFHDSAELVADLVEAADDYLMARTDLPPSAFGGDFDDK